MGSVYRRQVRFCTCCDRRLATTAARRACGTGGRAIDSRGQKICWIKYQLGGRPQCVSSRSDKKKVAEDLLKEREGAVVQGWLSTAQMGKIRFDEAAEDYLNEYRTNRRRSLATVQGRIENHLAPYFGGRRMTTIGTADTRAFVT